MDLQAATFVDLPGPEAIDATSERALIDRARADPRAFETLYRRYYRAVAGCIYRRTGDVHATEDLAADTFIAAFRSIRRYRHSDAPFRFWLYRIATNTVNRWARRRARMRLADAPHIDKTAPDATRPCDADLIATLLTRLPAKHQAVVSLHYFESLSVEETARVLGCSPGTIKSRLSRARESLRALIEEGETP